MSTAFSGVSRCAEPSRCERKSRALLVDRAPRGQAEDLVAAAVGQDRPRPADERVEAAAPRDEVVAGPQIEMIGVAQENVGAELLEIAVHDALDGALRADRHEGRRLNVAVRGRHHAAAGAAIRVGDAKARRRVDMRGRTVYNREADHHGGHGGHGQDSVNGVLCVHVSSW